MKKCALLFVLIMDAISCENFLDEDLSPIITLENSALSNEEGLLAALAGAYKPLGQTWNRGFSTAAVQSVLMGSDDLTTSMPYGNMDRIEVDRFILRDTNQILKMIWDGCYKSIQGCNNIIANWENATGDATVIRQIAGEAFFLRAYNYFWIVRLWGEAPLVLETYNFTEEILSIESSSVQAIYDQIVSDLLIAEELMGDTKPQTGRVCKGTAKAILAEVYLHMAGWPLNDVSYYALAADKAKEVIDNETAYGFGLVEDFADLWPTEITPVVSNVEEVFTLTFWNGSWWNTNAMYGTTARPAEEGGWDDYFCELTFFYEFPEGYRKDVTFYTELADGTPWQDFRTGHPYYKKFFGNNSFMNIHNIPLERMAEVYLIFAEARIMTSGSIDAEALEAVNKIRRRAAGLPVHMANPSVDWTFATHDQIVEEKGWEFAGEFCRWFDLVRLQKVEEVVAKKHPDDWQPLGPIQYFMPIPASETLINPNLDR